MFFVFDINTISISLIGKEKNQSNEDELIIFYDYNTYFIKTVNMKIIPCNAGSCVPLYGFFEET